MENLDSILLIDDDPICNFLHSRLLNKLNISDDVKVSLNGREALAHIDKVSKMEHCPQLIFLDINMPVMDGIDFMKSFNEKAFCKRKPVIIILTTSSNPNDIKQMQRYPEIKGFLNKPLSAEMITSILSVHFA
jgi:CheY-like chemotaxis protein